MTAWLLLVYRVPTEPASRRVTIWRDLKRMGALYLQQCVCIVPSRPELRSKIDRLITKIDEMDGESTLFDIPTLRPTDEAKIVQAFRELRNKEYAEIIEECETKFVKEIEFEHFRRNYTYEESEEIAQDLEKIRRWFNRIVARDWFGADRRTEVESWIARCAELLAEFEQTVYHHNTDEFSPDAAGSTTPRLQLIRPDDQSDAEESGT